MSFQAYIDNIEKKTGKSGKELVNLAIEKGFLDQRTKAMTIVNWLKKDFGLGHGHAMAIVLLIKEEREKQKA